MDSKNWKPNWLLLSYGLHLKLLNALVVNDPLNRAIVLSAYGRTGPVPTDPLWVFVFFKRTFTFLRGEVPIDLSDLRCSLRGEFRFRLLQALRTRKVHPLTATLMLATLLRALGNTVRLCLNYDDKKTPRSLNYHERRALYHLQLGDAGDLSGLKSLLRGPTIVIWLEVWWKELESFVPIELYTPSFFFNCSKSLRTCPIEPAKGSRLKLAELNAPYIHKFGDRLLSRIDPKPLLFLKKQPDDGFRKMVAMLDSDDDDEGEDDPDADATSHSCHVAWHIQGEGLTAWQMNADLQALTRSFTDEQSPEKTTFVLPNSWFWSNIAVCIAVSPAGFVADVTSRYRIPPFDSSSREMKRKKLSKVVLPMLNDIWTTDVLEEAGPKVHIQADTGVLVTWDRVVQTLPTSKQGFTNHASYVLASLLKPTELLADNPVVHGYFRGEPVYGRDQVITLRSRREWLAAGRSVPVGAKPSKVIQSKKRVRQAQVEPIIVDTELFPFEVTIPVEGEAAFPADMKAKLFNIRRMQIPEGWRHFRESKWPKIGSAAKRLDLDYYGAIVGFDYQGGQLKAKVDGVLVKVEDVERLLDYHQELYRRMVTRQRDEALEKAQNVWTVLAKHTLAYGNWKRNEKTAPEKASNLLGRLQAAESERRGLE